MAPSQRSKRSPYIKVYEAGMIMEPGQGKQIRWQKSGEKKDAEIWSEEMGENKYMWKNWFAGQQKINRGARRRGGGKQGVEKCCTQAVWPNMTWLMKQQLLSTHPCWVCLCMFTCLYLIRGFVSGFKDSVEQSDGSHFPSFYGRD